MKIKQKRFLLTGGTGSFGKAFVHYLLTNYSELERLVIFSRDEQKHFRMQQEFPKKEFPQVRFFIGDVRDRDRLQRAVQGIDTIIHAAAMKHVPLAEYNPMECIKTNILGAQNVIECALDSEVEHVITLSSDKAAAPINLYGATKLASDKLFIAANNIRGVRNVKFSVVRYGNVMGSNGSVIPFFIKRKRASNTIPITHPKMTRFNITLIEGIKMVMYALQHQLGGEIYVPKIPSYRILDVAEAIAPNHNTEIVGVRPGEKLHEEMITLSDSLNTYDIGKYYVILPQEPHFEITKFLQKYDAQKVSEDFSYNSGKNTQWVSIEELRKLIRKHVDTTFLVSKPTKDK